MNIAAYKRTISDTETPRQMERRILASATASLEQFLPFDEIESPTERLEYLSNGLREAIWTNQKVWIAFKHDLIEANNGLPPGLRAALISLSVWVDNHSAALLGGKEKIEPLVAINRSIISGLSGNTLAEVE